MSKISKLLITLILATVLTPWFLGSTPVLADVYSSYKQLAAKQTINKDYRITSINNSSNTVVIAPHGGGIEVGTCSLAKSVAKKTGASLYTFEGIKKANNNILHITSANFDEPIAKKLVASSTKTLSIHGCRGSSNVTYVGGKDTALKAKVRTELKKAGFAVAIPPPNLAGTNSKNIVNQNKPKKGVQLELTYSMRQALLKNNTLYTKYVNALSRSLK